MEIPNINTDLEIFNFIKEKTSLQKDGLKYLYNDIQTEIKRISVLGNVMNDFPTNEWTEQTTDFIEGNNIDISRLNRISEIIFDEIEKTEKTEKSTLPINPNISEKIQLELNVTQIAYFINEMMNAKIITKQNNPNYLMLFSRFFKDKKGNCFTNSQLSTSTTNYQNSKTGKPLNSAEIDDFIINAKAIKDNDKNID